MERKPLTGVDANVLLRFILRDDPVQAAQARVFFSSLTPRESGYISLIVLSECAWILARLYKFSRSDIGEQIEQILGMAVLEVERPVIAQRALELFRTSRADFGDCCIAVVGAAAGCESTVTFDKAASKLPGMRLLGNSSI